MKRACVIGWPISHSLSPVIHGFWLREHGIEGEYGKAAIEPKDFADFVRGFAAAGLAGGNVTVPHKLEAFRLAERRDAAAVAIGAVNTLWLDGGKLHGANTDAFGFLANLDEQAPGWDKPGAAVVIGAGGAARAIVWALIQRGFADIRIVNRTKATADALAAEFPPATSFALADLPVALDRARFVVNTSTLGMKGQPPLDIDLSPVAADATVNDIVYTPLETPLLAQARARGLVAVDGLGMLLHQAAPGFERWFGARPRVTPELRAAVLDAIAAREAGG
ncbi:shikimate dehydrogenase [Rhodomicrobium lacus]|uniref:shikimate dehydrogenase n=1 Tax=Rhodomicrobium lacus TaxID=2498452 RepID=UPI000F8D185F|nr:shikimate dehydrogenase [Rhodomicrobium lacus]